MRHTLMRSVLVGIFCLGLIPYSYAKDLQMSYQEYLHAQPLTPNSLKGYDHLIIGFQPGDKIQLQINGNLFQTDSAYHNYVIVKSKFWLRMPIGSGDLALSTDGTHYTKLEDSFHSDRTHINGFTLGQAVGLENFGTADITLNYSPSK